MIKRRFAGKCICLLVIVPLICAPLLSLAERAGNSDPAPLTEAADQTVTALYAQIGSLRAQQRALDEEIAKQAQAVSGVSRQKELMERQIALLYQEISCYNGILAYYDQLLSSEEALVLAEQAAYDAEFAVLSERLRQSYEEGTPGLLELFQRSDSLLSLLVGIRRREEIAQYDRTLMSRLEERRVALLESEEKLDALRTARHKAAVEQVERRQLLSGRLELCGSYLLNLQTDLDRFSYYLQESQAGQQMADRAVLAAIAALEKKIQAEGNGFLLEEKAAKETLYKAEILAAVSAGTLQEGGEYFAKGNPYIWPMALTGDRAPATSLGMGYCTYQVGSKIITDYHGGVDLAADYGTAVVASASGRVVQTGYEEGYGHYVVVYHPDGAYTRYAHLGEVTAKTGDYVLQGEAIAIAGCSGNSSGVGCHFELWIGGLRQNPLDHLTVPVKPAN